MSERRRDGRRESEREGEGDLSGRERDLFEGRKRKPERENQKKTKKTDFARQSLET